MPYPPANPDEMWNWDEFVAAAKADHQAGNRTTVWSLWIENALLDSHGLVQRREIFNEDYSRCVLAESDTAKEALRKILESVKSTGFPDASYMENMGMNAAQMLQTGRVAMLADGSWALQELAMMDFPVA